MGRERSSRKQHRVDWSLFIVLTIYGSHHTHVQFIVSLDPLVYTVATHGTV